jgi:hypothetical protein
MCKISSRCKPRANVRFVISLPLLLFSMASSMLSSTIWKKNKHVNFSNTITIVQVQRTSTIYDDDQHTADFLKRRANVTKYVYVLNLLEYYYTNFQHMITSILIFNIIEFIKRLNYKFSKALGIQTVRYKIVKLL